MAESVVPNQIVAGKYRLERTLGRGGMGVVVAARHLELDQLVAIKFLLPEIAEHGDAAERFRREARAAVRIRSEHVCRVLDVGTLETGVPYMVMEYLEGHDLASELQSRSRLPVEEAVDYVLQACEAIAEAHAAGIVHRDLKPANLFLAQMSGGTRGIKVLDFGVSKSVIQGEVPQLQLTRTSSIIGSPIYMSPEQLEASRDIDGRADIWGLGTILYELIAGRTPFVAETIAQLVRAVMIDPPPLFAAFGVAVPAELEAVIQRALDKQRASRFASVNDFARALLPFAPPHSRVSLRRVSHVQLDAAISSGPSTPAPGSGAAGPAPASGDAVASGNPRAPPSPELQRSAPRIWSSTSNGRRSRNLWFAAAGLLAFGVVAAGAALHAFTRAAPPRALPSASTLPVVPAPRTAELPQPSAEVETAAPSESGAPPAVSAAPAPLAPSAAPLRVETVPRRPLTARGAVATLDDAEKQPALHKTETPKPSSSRAATSPPPADPTTPTFHDFGGRR